jgi:hypothetical protein
MKKLLVFLFVLGVSNQLFAEIKNKDVIGTWKYTVVTDQGDMTGNLVFKETEGKLTGEVVTNDSGTFPMEKVELKEGNILYFELTPEYDTIKVSVKVEGKKFKGTGSTTQGEFDLTGEKVE